MRAIPRFNRADFFTPPYISRTVEKYGLGAGPSYVDRVVDGLIKERWTVQAIRVESPIPVAYCFMDDSPYRPGGLALDFNGKEVVRTTSSNRRFLERDLTKLVQDMGYEALWPHYSDDKPGLWIPSRASDA